MKKGYRTHTMGDGKEKYWFFFEPEKEGYDKRLTVIQTRLFDDNCSLSSVYAMDDLAIFDTLTKGQKVLEKLVTEWEYDYNNMLSRSIITSKETVYEKR